MKCGKLEIFNIGRNKQWYIHMKIGRFPIYQSDISIYIELTLELTINPAIRYYRKRS